MSLPDLRGRTVLVTGATRGIGRAIALAFAREGARVAANGRDPALLDSLANEAPPGLVLPLVGDVSREEDARLVVERAGPVDVLVNNAGVTFYGPVEETPEAELRRVMETNFFAATRVTRLVLPRMRERKGGAIVQVSSPAGRRGFPMISAYSASKAALNAWSEALRAEVASLGIRVILVYPDVTTSELYRNAPSSTAGKAYQEHLIRIDRDPPEKVARQVVRAVKRGKLDNYSTFRSRLLPIACGISPRMVDWLVDIKAPR